MNHILIWAFVCLVLVVVLAPGQVVQRSGITITSSASITFLVIDPMGNRIGTDPSNGSDVKEIAASWYGYEDIGDLSDSGGVEWRSCYLRSKNPDTLRSGYYFICIHSSSDRTFSIDIEVGRGNQYVFLKRSGFARATRPITYRLTFSNDSTMAVTLDSVSTRR